MTTQRAFVGFAVVVKRGCRWRRLRGHKMRYVEPGATAICRDMMIEIPTGARWHVHDAQRKLACRARLPGARVYDLAVQSLREAKDRGMSGPSRLVLAFPASWLVNSPAISRVLRRWSLPPERQVWLELLELLEKSECCLLEDAVIEGLTGSVLGAHDTLSLADARHLEGAMMAVRIVARFAQGDEARPRAPAHALFRVVAALAEPPQIASGPVAGVSQRRAPLPDCLERVA